jgi:hypothetical protein
MHSLKLQEASPPVTTRQTFTPAAEVADAYETGKNAYVVPSRNDMIQQSLQ